MKANDLRIGNYIKDTFDVKKYEVRQFDLEDFSTMLNYKNSNHRNTYNPVKLNDEWIKSFGFENSKTQGKFFTKENNIGISTADDKYIFIQGNFVCQLVLREIEFVHELQNFYYALTGVELSVS